MRVVQIMTDPWRYNPGWEGWHILLGRELRKYGGTLQVECWTIAPWIRQSFETETDGIRVLGFPARTTRLTGFFSSKALRQLKALPTDTILHLQGDEGLQVYATIALKGSKPVVVQNHGTGPGGRWSEGVLWSLPIEWTLMARVDHFFVLSAAKRDYLRRALKVSGSRVTLQTMGVDFEEFRPFPKRDARSRLGIDAEGRVLLYVGPFRHRPDGAHLVIQAYDQLRASLDVALLAVGGHPSDPLYSSFLERTRYVFPFVRHEQLPLFYSAADVLAIYREPRARRYGGITVRVVEAAACGTPAVSNTLSHAPSEAEAVQIGLEPRSFEDFVECLKSVLRGKAQFPHARDVVRKHYDWNTIVARTMRVYREVRSRNRR